MTLPDPAEQPTLLVAEAANLLDVSRTTAYTAIREGTWPTTVIRVGNVMRIPTAAVLRLLEIDEADTDHSDWRVTMGGKLVRDEDIPPAPPPPPIPEEVPA